MKVAVIGAGIVGVTTAYELAADGHEVTVFERRGAVAEETSFANAGIVAPGYVAPWAAPGMPAKVLRHLLSRHAPVRVSWPLGAAQLRWIWRWWRACNPDTYAANRQRLQRLAFYSLERLHWLTDSLQLDYERSSSYLVLLRSEKDRRMVQPGLQVLRDAGVAFHENDEAPRARSNPPSIPTRNSSARCTCRTTKRRTAASSRCCSRTRHATRARPSSSWRACGRSIARIPPASSSRHRARRHSGAISRPSSCAAVSKARSCCGPWACSCRWRRCTATR
jgi:hypothetical protein